MNQRGLIVYARTLLAGGLAFAGAVSAGGCSSPSGGGGAINQDSGTALDSGGSPQPDASQTDAGHADAGSPDSGHSDASTGDSAAPDAAAPDAASGDTGATPKDSGPDALGPAAPTLGSVTFSRAVAGTLTAGTNALAWFTDHDFVVTDMRNPAAPVTSAPFVTTGKVLAAEYDELRSLGFLIDTSGTLTIVNLTTAAGAQVLVSHTIAPLSSGNALGISRVGNWVYILTASGVLPIQLTMQGVLPVAVTLGTSQSLSSAATTIAAGAGALHIGYASGVVETYTIDAGTGAPALFSSFNAGGGVTRLIGRGSTAIVVATGVGVAIYDCSGSTPTSLAVLSNFVDAVDARLLGRVLVLSLGRGEVVAVDLSNYASPRVITSAMGAVPTYVTGVAGNIFLGSGANATVLGVPPFVTATVPGLTLGAFPLTGVVPVTFSKPINPTTVTTANVTFTCGGSAVPGALTVTLDHTGIRFAPSSALPASTTCILRVSGVLDLSGLAVSASGSASQITFTTAASGFSPATNGASKFPHTTDGLFSNFADAGTDGGEWSDVTPIHGIYSYFYADYDGQYLYTMNDWFSNNEKIDPDCYNDFHFNVGGDKWEVHAYGNQTIKAFKNGNPVDTVAAGAVAGAGYGSSANESKAHTMYELKLPAPGGGSWGSQISDPGSANSCATLLDDTNIPGGGLVLGGGSSIGSVTVATPTAPTLALPADATNGVSLSPYLSWTGSAAANQFVRYFIELSTSSAFTTIDFFGSSWTTGWNVPSGALLGSSTYYWRVTASNGAGSAVSNVQSFTTQSPPVTGYENINVTVTGPGSVGSSPTGITCTSGSCTAGFPSGSPVYLTAQPNSGATFLGWYGACAGSGEAATLTPNASLWCGAVFDLLPDAGAPADGGTDATLTDAGVDATVQDSGATPDAATDAAGTDAASIDSGADTATASDAGTDAGADSGTDAGHDAGTDSGTDAGVEAGADSGLDSGHDAGGDSATSDAGTDAGLVSLGQSGCWGGDYPPAGSSVTPPGAADVATCGSTFCFANSGDTVEVSFPGPALVSQVQAAIQPNGTVNATVSAQQGGAWTSGAPMGIGLSDGTVNIYPVWAASPATAITAVRITATFSDDSVSGPGGSSACIAYLNFTP